jgi:hypothetical protein
MSMRHAWRRAPHNDQDFRRDPDNIAGANGAKRGASAASIDALVDQQTHQIPANNSFFASSSASIGLHRNARPVKDGYAVHTSAMAHCLAK